MRARLSFFALCLVAVGVFLATGPALAYYYPPANVPPGPPPNYNQVDTSYFVGTPELPMPPPDTGGLFVYYDQGSWCVANHLYSIGNSLEQFHCCVLAVLDQPPTVGVNVFAEEFEFWGDTTVALCLKQNDRWGWIPWGDDLYEIWWDVTTREWKDGAGDPNDFMRFRISGRAIDFNLCSSDHAGTPFGPDQIYLGANKTPLFSIPGFVDTYPGVDDPYQSQAGSDPTADPNVTIFTLKSDTPRSYNKNGLINFTDSYSCGLALDYGQRYAGTFAYEGNGVQFSTSNLGPPNRNPNIMITPDTSVFVCTEDSVMIWIFASDPDVDDTITVEKISGTGVYQPQTDLTPIYDEFYFHPDTSGVYEFIFRVTDKGGLTDQDTTLVTVQLNRPPELTCPDDGVINAGLTFISSDFSATDPDGDAVTVSFLDIDPSAANDPSVVNSHVEWVTAIGELGDYTIRLVATDPCGLADTCEFLVTVDEPTGDFLCPDDDSVHAGEHFVSTDFTVTYPECDPSTVEILEVSPPAANMPTIVEYHVEWQTTCAEDGDYIIALMTGAGCSVPDTCWFTVTVYNRPPEPTCPDYGTVEPMHLFISTDFHFSDPDGDEVSVSLLGIDPPAEHDPVIVERHVEWLTTCVFGDYVITLVATDPCGLADTCEFTVTLSFDPVPDFYIWVYPITTQVSQGNSVDYLVELNSMNGYHESCSLYASGLPAPPNTAVFDAPVMIPTEFTTMTVSTSPETDTGTYTLTVTGKEIGRAVAHSKRVYLKVRDSLTPLDTEDEAEGAGRPNTFALLQNQPNPFNPDTRISYYLPKDCQVRLTIYNVLGQKVRTLGDEYQTSGMHTVTWNGKTDSGNQLSSGIYFYRLEADSFRQTKKMTLMK